MIQTAALLYVLIIAGVIVFQLCLIAGAPWGRLTQGGRHDGVLPAPARIAAVLSVALLACMGAAIASSAGLPPHWPEWTGWAATGVQVLSMILNWVTPSLPERRLWGPITTAMLALCAFVVLAPS
jgi:hypothetical protein